MRKPLYLLKETPDNSGVETRAVIREPQVKTLTIHLPDDTAKRIDEMARKLGLSVEDLVQSSVDEKLQRLDMKFEDAAKRVVKKNADLYRRLA